MASDAVESILAALEAAPERAATLLEYHVSAGSWVADPRLYEAFGRRLISSGHPTGAYDLLREGLQRFPDRPELSYLRALALARGGSRTRAEDEVHALLRAHLPKPLQVEALSLAGRLLKDRHERAGDDLLRRRLARESARLYEQAHAVSGSSFPAVNAASMFLLAGQRKKARALAALAIREAQREMAAGRRSADYWLHATLGESHLVLDRLQPAHRHYAEATRLARGQAGDVAAMRRQLRLLARVLDVSPELMALFHTGRVVAFAGHMIDHPLRVAAGSAQPRFPDAQPLVERVGRALEEALGELEASVGYCSVACGSDLLFAEQMLDRGAELHVVLPFDLEDFYLTSVDYGMPELAGWRRRCDAVLARVPAGAVHWATKESYLGDDVLFEWVNTVTQGLAVTRADELGIEACALAVLDPGSPAGLGGTAYFVERWRAAGRGTRVIDLQALRGEALPVLPAVRSATRPRPAPEPRIATVRRQVKAMLFADVRNFSKLAEEQTPRFFMTFLGEVAGTLRSCAVPPEFRNTWGDGLFLVFDRVADCADFALRLLDRVAEVDWAAVGLPPDTTVRMGIHAGPVYPGFDPIVDRDNFFGSHVNRAARIEPVTLPGCAFASEQFAAALAVEAGHDFFCEYVGVEEFAKQFDRCPLYRLARRQPR